MELPPIADQDKWRPEEEVCIRRSISSFFHVELFNLVEGIGLPVKCETCLQWYPNFARITVFNANHMLNWPMFRLHLPIPGSVEAEATEQVAPK